MTEKSRDGGRQARLTMVGKDGDLCILFDPGRSVSEVLAEANVRIRTPCGGAAVCGLCRVKIAGDRLNSLTSAESIHLSREDQAGGIRLACQVKPLSDVTVVIPGPLPVTDWRPLPDEEYGTSRTIPGFIAQTGARPGRPLGIALDLGTTQMRISLWDMHEQRHIAGRVGLNPQIHAGEDVLTRLTAASASERESRDLAWLVRGAIGEAILDMCRQSGFPTDRIGRIAIVGNTAMLCLLCQSHHEELLQPERWTTEIEYVPHDTADWKKAWAVDAETEIDLLPSVAGFVGADFLAATLATRLQDGAAPALLIDFGTNSEIGLWDGSTLWTTSAAGGPAFEGSGISCGMPAEPGAIFKAVRHGPGFLCETINGIRARGVCGSGMVDIIAGLLEAGILNSKGRFLKPPPSTGIFICPSAHDITLKSRDIDTFQRAKAAITAGILCLLMEARLRPADLQRVCVCGAFGHFLNLANAERLGLLPKIPPDRIEMHGDAALRGCELLLLSPDRAELIRSAKSRARIVDLAGHPDFESRFFEGLFLEPIQTEPPNRETRT